MHVLRCMHEYAFGLCLFGATGHPWPAILRSVPHDSFSFLAKTIPAETVARLLDEVGIVHVRHANMNACIHACWHGRDHAWPLMPVCC
eukprot:272350-Chlamydomonas_euryale.AAC.2